MKSTVTRARRLALWLSAVFVQACASSPGGFSGDAGPEATADDRRSSDGGVDRLVHLGDSAASGAGCSGDLQQVVDSRGNVIETCPPDQGCSHGTCIAACAAAAASKGSIGCDFASPSPPLAEQGSSFDGACYAVFLANTWGRSAKISVTYAGKTLDPGLAWMPSGVVPSVTYSPVPPAGLPPGQVAVLFLSHKPGAAHPNFHTSLECPKTPGVVEDAAITGSGRGNAFHVTSDTPVTAYDIAPYGGALSYLPSASLLFPTTAWGDNYVAVAPHPDGGGPLWMTVVGAVDGTNVTVAPASLLPGGPGLSDAPAGTSSHFTLDAGESIQWMNGDPTSAVLQADQPIGLFAGSAQLNVVSATSETTGLDSAHQQIPQVKALGSEYVGPGIVTRMASLAPESVVYRVLGVVDGTTLTWDPSGVGPATLAAGGMAEFETTADFVVRSQDPDHPFVLTQYMSNPPYPPRSGCGPIVLPGPKTPGVCPLGDTDWISLVPPAQFLSRYVFFTDPTYGTTNLVVTRERLSSGFSDVTIDCLGTVNGFTPVGDGSDYEIASVDLVRGGVPVSGCGSSRHEATSSGPFGILVWGTDAWASYGYPAGGSVASINAVVVPPPK